MDKDETYYEILRIPRNATISEIVAAYHSSRAAFSKDSIAMYSLFSQDEADKVLSKLEEAYLVLSNIDKKREYDRMIASGETPHAPILPVSRPVIEVPKPPPPPVTPSVEEATDPSLARPETVSGALLKTIRERRSLSVEDVSRITKIPQRFLVAIEEEDVKALPAKVYIQGFIKNLSSLYKLDPTVTARHFVQLIDSKKTGT